MRRALERLSTRQARVLVDDFCAAVLGETRCESIGRAPAVTHSCWRDQRDLDGFGQRPSAWLHTSSERWCNTAGKTENTEEDRKEIVIEDLLDAALEHVNEHGWTQRAIQQGAHDLGLSPAASNRVRDGATGLSIYYVRMSYLKTIAKLLKEKAQWESKSLKERLAFAFKTRLMMNAPHVESLPQALGLLAHPNAILRAFRQQVNFVDDVWCVCGDKSMNASWYTKRMLMCAVYAACEVHMLTDFSPGYQDTWKMLDARIEDVLWMEESAGDASKVLRRAMQTAKESTDKIVENFKGVKK